MWGISSPLVRLKWDWLRAWWQSIRLINQLASINTRNNLGKSSSRWVNSAFRGKIRTWLKEKRRWRGLRRAFRRVRVRWCQNEHLSWNSNINNNHKLNLRNELSVGVDEQKQEVVSEAVRSARPYGHDCRLLRRRVSLQALQGTYSFLICITVHDIWGK